MLVYRREQELLRVERQESERLTIVVQAYDKLSKTKTCVEHILKYAGNIPHQLWLEDNGSLDPEILAYYRSVPHPHKTIIRIEKNESSPKGINAFIPLIQTKYFLLVANDVYITPHCVENLLLCAESDPRIGMVNPVSTYTGHAQQEDLGGFTDDDDMIAKAEKFNHSDARLWDERMVLVPTAVLYKREVFDKVGLYDEDYPHDYGDNDLSFRIRRKGYKLMLCRDTFVHHDHLPSDRENPAAQAKNEAGRLVFRQKFYGLDAWDDMKTIAPALQKVAREETKTTKKILVVEPRCGTPLLDIKNYYRRQGIFDVEAHAFAAEGKYYTDLRSLTEHVVIDRLAFLAEHYQAESFDFAAICQPLAEMPEGDEVKEAVRRLVKKDGVLLTL